MKKIILVPALLGVMGIGGAIAAVGGNLVGSADSSKQLSTSEIEKRALQVVDGTIKEIEFEKEGKRSYYEVDIVTDDFEYDLKFDAFTGELLKKKKDDRDDDDLDGRSKQVQSSTDQSTNKDQGTPPVHNNEVAKQVNTNQAATKQVNNNETVKQVNTNQAAQTAPAPKPSTQTSKSSPQKLSVNEIKAKALSIVNGKIVEIDFENDDNRSYYEVEIITNNAEYELKLDAYSGALLEKEVDDLDDDDRWDDDDDDDRWDD